MNPTQRMESAINANPDIGRYKLMEAAQVGEKAARLFLRRKRSEIAGNGDPKRGALMEKLGGLRDAEIEVILRGLKKPQASTPNCHQCLKPKR